MGTKISKKGKVKNICFFKEAGITLVSLVVTIIILIILAGITIGMIVGDDGLIQKTKNAAVNFANKQGEEHFLINDIYNEIYAIQNKDPGEMPAAPEGTILFGAAAWNNGIAAIQITTGEGQYTIQYQKNSESGEWISTDATSVIVTGLNHGDTIYARLWNGNSAGSSTSKLIQDITVPEKATIELSATSTTTEGSITATVTHTDNQSGVDMTKCKWIYTTTQGELGLDAFSSANLFNSNGETITLSTATVGTYYLHILTVDKAGKTTETVSNAITVKSNVVAFTSSDIGKFVNYDAGKWTTAQINSLGSLYAGYNYADKGTFAGFKAGTSRNDCAYTLDPASGLESGWRVLSVDSNGTATLVHASVPEKYEHTTGSNSDYTPSKTILNSTRDWSMYLDGNFASSVAIMSYEQALNITHSTATTTNNLRTIGENYYVNKFASDGCYYVTAYGLLGNRSGLEFGIRLVINLKPGVGYLGGSGTSADPLQLKQ